MGSSSPRTSIYGHPLTSSEWHSLIRICPSSLSNQLPDWINMREAHPHPIRICHRSQRIRIPIASTSAQLSEIQIDLMVLGSTLKVYGIPPIWSMFEGIHWSFEVLQVWDFDDHSWLEFFLVVALEWIWSSQHLQQFCFWRNHDLVI